MNERNHFGQFVRQRRESLGLISRNLAAQLDLDPSTLSRLETGAMKTLPDPALLRRLADALNVTVPDLLAAAGYLRPEETAAQTFANPFPRDDIRYRVVEAMRALDLSGPDGPFLSMYFRLKLRDLLDFGQYGVGDDDVSNVVIDHEAPAV